VVLLPDVDAPGALEEGARLPLQRRGQQRVGRGGEAVVVAVVRRVRLLRRGGEVGVGRQGGGGR
jgi:hypothetical protein